MLYVYVVYYVYMLHVYVVHMCYVYGAFNRI